jgi:hypothetical protein
MPVPYIVSRTKHTTYLVCTRPTTILTLTEQNLN